MATKENTIIDACKNAFGGHPEDVISPIKSAADALSWLEELFRIIERDALNKCSGYRIKRLAGMGAYLAFDMANFADCEHENMRNKLIDAGIIREEQGVATRQARAHFMDADGVLESA